MNLSDIICDLWKPLRMLLKSNVQFAASSAKTLAHTAIDILEDTVDAIGDLGGGGAGKRLKRLAWIAAACLGAWFLIKNSNDDSNTEILINERTSP